MLSGASVRYRFYTRWGVTAEEFSRVMFSYLITFWLGLLALGGLSLALTPFPAQTMTLIAPVGWGLAGLSLVYIVATAVRREPFRVGRFELPLPTTRVALAQFTASILDWALAGAVFYVLLPVNGASLFAVLGARLSCLLGLATCRGIGIFEGRRAAAQPYHRFFHIGAAAAFAYRLSRSLIFCPLCVALVALLADEVWRGEPMSLGSRRFDRAGGSSAAPLGVFALWAACAVSGATPAASPPALLTVFTVSSSSIHRQPGRRRIASALAGLARRLTIRTTPTAFILATIALASQRRRL